jgi:hypothetical protein
MGKKIYAEDGLAVVEVNGMKITLSEGEVKEALEAIRVEKYGIQGKGDFITLYTDASYKHSTKEARLAYRGKCKAGVLEGSIPIDEVGDSNLAEMLAIEAGVKASLEKYPNVIGFFIRSDNLTCVHAFWDFDREKYKVAKVVAPSYSRIQQLLGGRWTRVKHVKGHSNERDTGSYMNRKVDKMTRVRGAEVVS